jgi:histidine triad (HIT) family protein
MTDACVFCGIARAEVPASTVYRDDTVMAFMDIRPVNTGHVLVVPLKHETSLLELDEGMAARMFTVGTRIASALKACGVRLDGFNLFLADGEVAGQEVFHVHLHVVPRFRGDGLGWIRPDHDGPPTRSELEDIAQRIRRAGGWE